MSDQETTASERTPEHSCCCRAAKGDAPPPVSGGDRMPKQVNTRERLSGSGNWLKVLRRIWQRDRAGASPGSAA